MARSQEIHDAALRVSFILSRRENWLQGTAYGHRKPGSLELAVAKTPDDFNCMCLGHAINVVTAHDSPRLRDALRCAFNESIITQLGESRNLVTFNDSPDTTYRDMRAVIDRVVEDTRPIDRTRIPVCAGGNGWAI